MDLMIDQTVNKAAEDYMKAMPDYAPKPFEWRLSASGKCPTLMDYEMLKGRIPFDFKGMLRTLRGTHLHTMWQEILSDLVTDQEGEVTLELSSGRKILGHYDGIIKQWDAVYELKNIGDYTYTKVINHDAPLAANIEQANIYAYLLGRANTLMHYFNTSTCDSAYFLVPTNKQLALKTKEKWEVREKVLEHKMIEPRPYQDPTLEPCWYCDYKEDCYKGFKEKVSAMAVTKMDHDTALYDDLVVAVQANAVRLRNDKIEKKTKEKLSKYLLSMGVKAATCKDISINIKLGKNDNPLATIKQGVKKK